MITEAWIEKVSRVLHNSDDGLSDEDIRALHDLRKAMLPMPGAVEKEVEGSGGARESEFREWAGEVGQRQDLEKAARIMLKPQEDLVAAHVNTVEQRNLHRFLQFIALNDPRGFDAIAPHLHRVSSPRRYQAWGQIGNAECPLWTKGTAGGDLELMNRSDSCGDRIELIDRVGIVPDPGVINDVGTMLLFEDPESIRLVTHNLETYGHRSFPFKYITQPGGVKLTGAARLLVMPRSIVPRIQLRCPFKGQVFVEGWRVSLG